MPDRKAVQGQTLHRALVLDREQMQPDERVVPASLSSEVRVERIFGIEVLSHDPKHVDLSRSPLPLLWGHDMDQPIGKVEDVRVEGGRLRGNLRFSRNKRASEVWDDVREGFLDHISIGYMINDFEDLDDGDGIRATRWTPHEVSVVSVPADHTVGINRSKEVAPMAEKESQAGTDAGQQPTVQTKQTPADFVQDFQMHRERNVAQGRDAGVASERSRIKEIRALFARKNFQSQPYMDLMDSCIDNGVSVEQTRDYLLEMIGQGQEPIIDVASTRQADPGTAFTPRQVLDRTGQNTRNPRIQNGEDALDKFRRGAIEAVTARGGLLRKDEKADLKNEFRGYTLMELARKSLEIQGISTAGMDKRAMVGLAFTAVRAGMHTTSDFSNILVDTANKAALMGAEEAGETFQMWTRKGTLTDFRPAQRVDITSFGTLPEVPEGAEYTYGTIGDRGETIQLATYGKLINFSRQAVINDDLDMFSRVPRLMGRAAIRTVGNLVYSILTGNPTMSDGVTLFHANHSNLLTAADITTTSVDAMAAAMAKQTDASGNATALNIDLAYLIVPRALRGTALTVRDSQYEVTASNKNNTTPNSVRNTFDVIADPRLDAASAFNWYGAANPNLVDTIEVSYLDGNDQPYLEQEQQFTVDGASYKVRIDAGVAALDFRGLAKNPDAS